jgi:hypothetical protein
MKGVGGEKKSTIRLITGFRARCSSADRRITAFPGEYCIVAWSKPVIKRIVEKNAGVCRFAGQRHLVMVRAVRFEDSRSPPCHKVFLGTG